MRIESIKARNFKAFEDFQESFGEVNIISGRNGQGKSTILDMVYAAFVTDGGRNLLRTGAEEGEFVVTLREDDGEMIEIRRTLKPGSVSAPIVKSSKSGAMNAAASFLKTLVDTATMDPIRRVMLLPPAEQAKILLETIPLDLDHAELRSAVAGVKGCANLPAILKNAASLPALDAIKAVEEVVFKERTLVNRDVKTQTAHAQQLRSAVGLDGDGTDWAAVEEEKAKRSAWVETESRREIAAADMDYSKDRESIMSRQGIDLEEINADIDRRIKILEIDRNERKAERIVEAQEALDKIAAGRVARLAVINEKYAGERHELAVSQRVAREHAVRQAGAIQTKENAENAETQAKNSKSTALAMTAALESLDTLRGKLLEKLPIPGLKVEGGCIYLNGVPLQEVNTGQQGRFWVSIAVRRAIDKGLGTVIIDDAEHFDDVNFPILLEGCKNSGLQFFIGRVAPHPFKIERWNP